MYRGLDRIGFGCIALSTLPSRGAAQKLLEGVLDVGITHFDTAPIYGKGYSERILGEFLRHRRDRVTVATKFGLGFPNVWPAPIWLALQMNYVRKRWLSSGPVHHPSSESGARGPDERDMMMTLRRITRAEIAESFEGSCRALRTDYLDLYLLHEGLPCFLDHDALEYLCELKKRGAIRQTGLAAGGRNYHALMPAQLAEWEVLQYEFGPAWPDNASLLRRFPNKTHIFHSCLKGVTGSASDTVAGRVLAECCAANPGGKVLFSSSNLEHVRKNARALASA